MSIAVKGSRLFVFALIIFLVLLLSFLFFSGLVDGHHVLSFIRNIHPDIMYGG